MWQIYKVAFCPFCLAGSHMPNLTKGIYSPWHYEFVQLGCVLALCFIFLMRVLYIYVIYTSLQTRQLKTHYNIIFLCHSVSCQPENRSCKICLSLSQAIYVQSHRLLYAQKSETSYVCMSVALYLKLLFSLSCLMGLSSKVFINLLADDIWLAMKICDC